MFHILINISSYIPAAERADGFILNIEVHYHNYGVQYTPKMAYIARTLTSLSTCLSVDMKIARPNPEIIALILIPCRR